MRRLHVQTIRHATTVTAESVAHRNTACYSNLLLLQIRICGPETHGVPKNTDQKSSQLANLDSGIILMELTELRPLTYKRARRVSHWGKLFSRSRTTH
jgi:hypothetical protein